MSDPQFLSGAGLIVRLGVGSYRAQNLDNLAALGVHHESPEYRQGQPEDKIPAGNLSREHGEKDDGKNTVKRRERLAATHADQGKGLVPGHVTEAESKPRQQNPDDRPRVE